MKPMFIASATIGGVISFCYVRAILTRNQKVYDAKMAVMDDFFNRPK